MIPVDWQLLPRLFLYLKTEAAITVHSSKTNLEIASFLLPRSTVAFKKEGITCGWWYKYR